MDAWCSVHRRFSFLGKRLKLETELYNVFGIRLAIAGLATGSKNVQALTVPRFGHSDGPRHITLSEARSRLDRSRFSRPNTHFSAFFKIYKKIIFSRANLANFCIKIAKFCKTFDSFLQILQNFQNFQKSAEFLQNFCRIFCRILQKLVDFEKC